MPKRLTDEQRGPLGAWIVHQREARGWEQDSMAERLKSKGYGIRQDYYRQLEAGKKPGPDLMAALERLFEAPYVAPAPPPAELAPPDLSSLLLAMEQQTAALNRLAEAIETDRKRTQTMLDEHTLAEATYVANITARVLLELGLPPGRQGGGG